VSYGILLVLILYLVRYVTGLMDSVLYHQCCIFFI